MRTRIENVTLLTCDKDLNMYENSSLTIEGDRIIAINQNVPYDTCIDGKNGILLPGFINTHTHLSMIPFRSLKDDLPDRLQRFLFPLEKEAMSQDLAVASAKIGVAESLLSGVTTVYDMYYYADALATCYEEMGMRAFVAQTIVNQNICDQENEQHGLDLAKKFYEKWKNHQLIHPALGPHGTTTVTEETLLDIQRFAYENNVPVCMHVAEMDYEMSQFEKKGTSPIQYLEKLKLLNSNFVAVHVIHASENDLDILKKHEVVVAHCVGANTKAAKGIAPLKTMIEKGICVGLGTDGPSRGNTLDLFVQMNLVAKLHKVHNHDRKLFPAKEIVQLSTFGGAHILNLEQEIGSLEVGKKADLVLVETQSINMYPNHDPYSLLVYSANSSNVDSVWINGIIKVKNKILVDFDINTLKADCTLKQSEFLKKTEELNIL